MGLYNGSDEERIMLYLHVKDLEDVVALANAVCFWREKIFRPTQSAATDSYFVRKMRRQEALKKCLVPGEEITMMQLLSKLGRNGKWSYKSLQRDIAELALAGIVTLPSQRTETSGAKTFVKLN